VGGKTSTHLSGCHGRGVAADMERSPPRRALPLTYMALVGVLLAAAAVRLAWVGLSKWQPLPDDDAFRYDWFARNLAAGHGFIHLNGEPTAFWPPGYPFLLAALYKLLGTNALWGQLLNAGLGVGVVALTYLVGRRALSQRSALLAAALVAFFPSLVLFTGVTLSETAFTFFVLLILWILLQEQERRRPHLPSLALVGIVAGYAALIRGQALLLPVIAIPFWWVASRNWRYTALRFAAVAAFTVLTVAPWTIRNALQMNAFVPISTNVGVDLWIGHHDGASGRNELADELVYSHPDLDSVSREVVVNNEGFRRAFEFALQQPLTELQLLARKLFYLYYHDEEGLRWNEGHGGQPWLSATVRSTLRALSDGYYYLVMALALAGSLLLGRRLRRPGLLLAMATIVYWTAIHLVFCANPRFHAPVMPLVCLFAAVALEWLLLQPAPSTSRPP